MSRAGDLKARKACMHVAQEEDLQVLRAASLRKDRKPPAHAPWCQCHTHAVLWHSTRSHARPTPPGAHATQLQTGLSKERGLAGTRATKSPVWGGISGRSSPPLPRSLVSSPAAARGKGSFPPSALAVSLVHVKPPRLTSCQVAVQPTTETGPVGAGPAAWALCTCG